MSVIVYIESQDQQIKKTSLEVAAYGRAVADAKSTSLIAVTFGLEDPEILSQYGIDKVYKVATAEASFFDLGRYSSTLAAIASEEEMEILIVSGSANGRYLGPAVAMKLEANYFSNVIGLPTSYTPLEVKRSCFTNKAFSYSSSSKQKAVLSIAANTYGIFEKKVTMNQVTAPYAAPLSTLKVVSEEKSSQQVSIADAEIVVSGGRGLKGPENWHLIEDLAAALGAATACSKPVSDMGWRPHSEHVGQTGKPVASNLYIAIGVSGAIQHLAGINSSKVKVVINNDPEAPFFKAADYGVVGDAFEVVPILTEKLKALKGN